MRVTPVIDNLDQAMAEKLQDLARLGRNRFEVVLDRIDGDHIELELHFRLTELTATQQLMTTQGVQSVFEGIPAVQPVPHRSELDDYITVGGLDGAGPLFGLKPPASGKAPVNIRHLASVIATLIRLVSISPQVLGIPDGPGDLSERIEAHLREDEHMGKHEKPGPDPKQGKGSPTDASGGGKHEKGGKGK